MERGKALPIRENCGLEQAFLTDDEPVMQIHDTDEQGAYFCYGGAESLVEDYSASGSVKLGPQVREFMHSVHARHGADPEKEGSAVLFLGQPTWDPRTRLHIANHIILPESQFDIDGE